jgi:hypothetical protein
MTVTATFAKTSSKRKSDKWQVAENCLREIEQNMKELAEVQDSVDKEAVGTADEELQVEKKVKLNYGDPEAEMLVSIILFCSFSKYGKYLIYGRFNAFYLCKLNCQAVSHVQILLELLGQFAVKHFFHQNIFACSRNTV